MTLREVGWESVGWMHLDRDREKLQALLNMEMNLCVSYKEEKFLTS
jgi:hypothetical protein